jgi:hypothetical protein
MRDRPDYSELEAMLEKTESQLSLATLSASALQTDRDRLRKISTQRLQQIRKLRSRNSDLIHQLMESDHRRRDHV